MSNFGILMLTRFSSFDANGYVYTRCPNKNAHLRNVVQKTYSMFYCASASSVYTYYAHSNTATLICLDLSQIFLCQFLLVYTFGIGLGANSSTSKITNVPFTRRQMTKRLGSFQIFEFRYFLQTPFRGVGQHFQDGL